MLDCRWFLVVLICLIGIDCCTNNQIRKIYIDFFLHYSLFVSREQSILILKARESLSSLTRHDSLSTPLPLSWQYAYFFKTRNVDRRGQSFSELFRIVTVILLISITSCWVIRIPDVLWSNSCHWSWIACNRLQFEGLDLFQYLVVLI